MIIYCNGDSYTAGSELGDNIIPEYPGLLDYRDLNKSKVHQYDKWKRRTHIQSNYLGKFRTEHEHQIAYLEKERSWPGKLSKQLGLHYAHRVSDIIDLNTPTVINEALGGSSMDRIARTTISHLIEFLHTTNDITVIIGLAPENRYEVGWEKQEWISVLPQHFQHESIQPLNKFKLTQESDYHIYVNFFKNIIYINEFCKVNKLKLYYISTCSPSSPNDDLLEKHPDLKRMITYADLQLSLKMHLIAKQIHTGVFCPHSHYSEIVHEQVAKEICTWLKL